MPTTRHAPQSRRPLAPRATAAAELVSLSATLVMGLADDQPDAGFFVLEARQRSPGPDTDRALLDTIAAAELGDRPRSVHGCR